MLDFKQWPPATQRRCRSSSAASAALELSCGGESQAQSGCHGGLKAMAVCSGGLGQRRTPMFDLKECSLILIKRCFNIVLICFNDKFLMFWMFWIFLVLALQGLLLCLDRDAEKLQGVSEALDSRLTGKHNLGKSNLKWTGRVISAYGHLATSMVSLVRRPIVFVNQTSLQFLPLPPSCHLLIGSKKAISPSPCARAKCWSQLLGGAWSPA